MLQLRADDTSAGRIYMKSHLLWSSGNKRVQGRNAGSEQRLQRTPWRGATFVIGLGAPCVSKKVPGNFSKPSKLPSSLIADQE